MVAWAPTCTPKVAQAGVATRSGPLPRRRDVHSSVQPIRYRREPACCVDRHKLAPINGCAGGRFRVLVDGRTETSAVPRSGCAAGDQPPRLTPVRRLSSDQMARAGVVDAATARGVLRRRTSTAPQACAGAAGLTGWRPTSLREPGTVCVVFRCRDLRQTVGGSGTSI